MGGDRDHPRDPDRPSVLEGMERKRREVDAMLSMMTRGGRVEGSPASFASTASSSLSSSPSLSRPSSDPWLGLHHEIIHFAQTCQLLQQQQAALRDDLSQRTRRAVKSVWPTAEVDLVGSVSAGVALPKSDLDFVVFFPVARDTEARPAYTFSAPLNEDGHATLDAAAIAKQQMEDGYPNASPSSSPSSPFPPTLCPQRPVPARPSLRPRRLSHQAAGWAQEVEAAVPLDQDPGVQGHQLDTVA